MGCAQAKPSMASPLHPGLAKFKHDNGYTPASRKHSLSNSSKERKSNAIGRYHMSENESESDSNPDTVKKEVTLNKENAQTNAGTLKMDNGWPEWLIEHIPKEILDGLVPKSADSYDMLNKVGQGTYSNVYKARERDTGKIVALKKVRFDTTEPESIRFMAREILILQKLDHPNVIKLEGLATSRMSYSLYLVFEFMHSDLATVISGTVGNLTLPQIKCYMQQLLSGLKHCHERGILHRDIKGSNLLIDKQGKLKIADFGLANYFDPNKKRPLTSRVVTLWYRAPELLLGVTDYGVGIDLWSVGCLFGEMFVGRPIMPGRTEVEQLHRIFKLCGSPTEDYWKKLKLSTSFRPPQPYGCKILEVFQEYPSSLNLLQALLALEPTYRGTATTALQNEFFSTSPQGCTISDLHVVYEEEDDDHLVKPREKRKNKRRAPKLNQRPFKATLQQQPEDARHSMKHSQEQKRTVITYSHELGRTTGGSSGSQPPRYSVRLPPTPPMIKLSPRSTKQRNESLPSFQKRDTKDTRKKYTGMDKRSLSTSVYQRHDEIHMRALVT